MLKKIVLTLAVVVATGIPSAAAAVPASPAVAAPSRAAAAPGFPTFVSLPADHAGHPQAANEWWYVVGHLFAGGHHYGYELVITKTMTQFAITDLAGTFTSHTSSNAPADVAWATTGIDVRTPDGTLTGPVEAMHLTAKLPGAEGSIDVTLRPRGPVLYNNGTGLVPFLGGATYYYSMPQVDTAGTLTVDGRTSRVSGGSWVDHQWGEWDWSRLSKWTWMGIQLDNGENIDLFDVLETQGEHSWATVLDPDGSHRLVTVEPLAGHARDFRTSPTTGQRYAGRWTVGIPALGASLTVTAQPVLQELYAQETFTQGVNNAAATVRGTYQGRPVSGKAYVEQLGAWN